MTTLQCAKEEHADEDEQKDDHARKTIFVLGKCCFLPKRNQELAFEHV